jgi:hypothetical protein
VRASVAEFDAIRAGENLFLVDPNHVGSTRTKDGCHRLQAIAAVLQLFRHSFEPIAGCVAASTVAIVAMRLAA